MVVVFPVPGGPNSNKFGKYDVLIIFSSMVRLIGSNTIAPKSTGLYFSTQGVHLFDVSKHAIHLILLIYLYTFI
jgi:hypothetical protein